MNSHNLIINFDYSFILPWLLSSLSKANFDCSFFTWILPIIRWFAKEWEIEQLRKEVLIFSLRIRISLNHLAIETKKKKKVTYLMLDINIWSSSTLLLLDVSILHNISSQHNSKEDPIVWAYGSGNQEHYH